MSASPSAVDETTGRVVLLTLYSCRGVPGMEPVVEPDRELDVFTWIRRPNLSTLGCELGSNDQERCSPDDGRCKSCGACEGSVLTLSVLARIEVLADTIAAAASGSWIVECSLARC